MEEIFGWIKTIALCGGPGIGAWPIGPMFTFVAAAYNLVRIRNLTWAEAGT